MGYAMPKIDAEKVSLSVDSVEQRAQERAILARILNKGALKATKPAIRAGTENELTDRCAAYVWRMVAFQAFKNPVHQCMPVCAEFDLPDFGSRGLDWNAPDFDEKLHEASAKRRALSKQLDDLADRIVDTLHPSQWHGVQRWGQAMGQIGTPQVAKDGSIIYR